MTTGVYTRKINGAFKYLCIHCNKVHHFGRDVGPALMDMQEVITDEIKNMGNWANDVFSNVYSCKLPLTAMRALAGYDPRRGYYKNPRTRFKGGGRYDQLAAQLFPWVEEEMAKLPSGECPTARSFLQLLKNLRWVILQDCAVMIGVHKRTHYLFKHMRHVFQSDSFKSYTAELLDHLSSNVDPNDEKVERLLPGVLGRMDQQVQATKEMHVQMSTHFKKHNIDALENSMKRVVKKSFGKFAEHIGNFEDSDSDNDPQLDDPQLVSQEVLQDNNEVTTESSVKAIDDHSTIALYEIPTIFENIDCMMDHWDFIIAPLLRKHKSNWRKHLTKADAKKFSRLKKVVLTAKKRIAEGEAGVLLKCQEYYSSKNNPLTKLADTYLK